MDYKKIKLTLFIILLSFSTKLWAVEWQDCWIGNPQAARSVKASCASIEIPENREIKNGRKIQLHLAKVWSWNKNKKADPVLFLSGGPGQSAIETYLSVEGGLSQLVKGRDIVLVDQRGTGKSNPLHCDIDESLIFSEMSEALSADFLKQCLAGLEADTRYYTTTESIKDLELVRKALDIKQWNLVGVSYGTRKALTYAAMFPAAIRTMVLDGVVHQQEPLGLSHEQNLQAALTLQFDACALQDACAKAFGDVTTTMHKLLKAADKKPESITLPHPITGEPFEIVLSREVLTTVIRMFSYSAETYRLLPLLLDLAGKGNYTPLASQALLVHASLNKMIALGLDMSILCAEDAPFFPEEDDSEAFFSSKTMPALRQKSCEHWPHIPVDPTFKNAVHSDIPTLLLSGEFDPVTPPAFADKAAETLSNSTHLVAKGLGHGVFMHGCMPFVIRDFIETPSESVDATCMQSFSAPAFFTTLMGPEQ